jgi:hypothetical protein
MLIPLIYLVTVELLDTYVDRVLLIRVLLCGYSNKCQSKM